MSKKELTLHDKIQNTLQNYKINMITTTACIGVASMFLYEGYKQVTSRGSSNALRTLAENANQHLDEAFNHIGMDPKKMPTLPLIYSEVFELVGAVKSFFLSRDTLISQVNDCTLLLYEWQEEKFLPLDTEHMLESIEALERFASARIDNANAILLYASSAVASLKLATLLQHNIHSDCEIMGSDSSFCQVDNPKNLFS